MRLLRFFLPPPPAPVLSDPAAVAQLYRHWRVRVMYSLLVGYALYYFCRKNYSIAMPAMARDLGLTNTQVGLIGGLLYITYGAGKFVNGVLGDHIDPRRFMALGLLLTAIANLAFGSSTSLFSLGLWWALNGWFQSMGFPPCARLLANWYSVSERGRTWGLWNTSHQIGAFGVAALVGYLAERSGWRSGFTAPALLCIAGAFFIWERVRDTPASMGLPPVARYRDDPERERDGSEVSDEPETVRQVLFQRVLRSREVWLVSLFNLFVYVVRSGAFDFATKFLAEQKGRSLSSGGLITSAFEIAGIPGSLLAGYLGDRYFRGRHAPVCFLCMVLTIFGLVLFYQVPAGHPWLDVLALAIIGFAIYGPQLLVGVFVTDLASRKAAATAIGLTGVFGYLGSFLSNVLTGSLVDRYGWGGGFACWIVAAAIGAVLTLPLWRVSARGRAAG